MLWHTILVLSYCLFPVQGNDEESPRIIIVGSGPAGIAAGARLLENGFNNITILEAENRIGGRVYTTEFGGYPVDVGGQWVHGEENNVVYELAWPLGLLEKSGEMSAKDFKVYDSSGSKMPEDVGVGLMNYFFSIGEMDVPDEYKNKSTGDWFTHKLAEYFEAHPDIQTNQREPLEDMLDLMEMALDSADTWFNVTLQGEYIICKGDQGINWKERGYGTIIDILLKKFPNPAEELPFVNKTILNTEVARINYNNSDGAVRVITENGDEYSADHVIVTPSLGVLKADHEKLFNPPLSEVKINAIKNTGFGSVAKIYLFYSEPWWPQNDSSFASNFFWTNEDKNELMKNPEKSWLLGMYGVFEVEHKPGLLCCWLTGPHAREMESIPEETVLSDTKEMLQRFLGKDYNLTEPTAMLRSQWYTNKHFRGTYSYESPETKSSGAIRAHLAEPIMENEKPRVMFAGEATSTEQSSTVHGAIGSGWREADRLIKFYTDKSKTTPTPQTTEAP